MVLAQGPLGVSIDASKLQFYKGGIMTPHNGCSSDPAKINHAVVIEGLGTYGNQRAWIVSRRTQG
jgi:hypothetical protein